MRKERRGQMRRTGKGLARAAAVLAVCAGGILLFFQVQNERAQTILHLTRE